MSLFGTEIQCPRCLKSLRAPARPDKDLPCKACKFVIPFAYLQDSKEMPPVFVQLVGLTAAGKTTFLDMLRLHLYDMDQVWPGFYAQPITQLDLDHKAILLNEREKGILSGSTPKRERDQNEAYIMALKSMARWNSRFLVLMDHSGEQFVDLNIKVEEIPFLQHTPVAIVLLSLSDLAREGKRVDDLVTSYIRTLEKYVNFAKERRQLIIVLSKADTISNLAPELHDYLSKDTIYMALRNPQQDYNLGETELEHYLQWMTYISERTSQWIRKNVLSGSGMLNMLNDRGISARFTVMSATGQPISGNKNTLVPTPRRVLDPLFWVLEYYKQNKL
jgi:Double-GTPase 2